MNGSVDMEQESGYRSFLHKHAALLVIFTIAAGVVIWFLFGRRSSGSSATNLISQGVPTADQASQSPDAQLLAAQYQQLTQALDNLKSTANVGGIGTGFLPGGQPVQNVPLVEGALYRLTNDNAVYQVQNGKLTWIGWNSFVSAGAPWDKVNVVPSWWQDAANWQLGGTGPLEPIPSNTQFGNG